MKTHQTISRTEMADVPDAVHGVALKALQAGGVGDMDDWTAAKAPLRHIGPLIRLYEEKTADAVGNTFASWNAFQHYKSWAVFPTNPRKLVTGRYVSSTPPWGHSFVWSDNRLGWPSGVFGPADNPTFGLWPMYWKEASGSFIKTVSDIDKLKAKSLRVMLGTCRPSMSLINSLIELKDFKKLPDTVRRVRATLSTVSKLVTSGGALRGGRSVKTTFLRILGTMADVFLQKEFNIDPLISDITAIRDIIETERSRIAKLLKSEAKLQTRHYNLSLKHLFPKEVSLSGVQSHIYSSATTDHVPDYLCNTIQGERIVEYGIAAFHAECQYSYYYTQWQRENALMLGLLDRLGVMFDPSIVWNAIPWSFAIDWVADVNQWLGQYRRGNMEPVTVVHRYLWSQRISRKITGTCYMSLPVLGGNTPSVTAVEFNEESYIRDLDGLNITAALSGSGINPHEFILASALALSRKR